MMKSIGSPPIATILSLIAAACCVSCNRPASNSTSAGKTAKPGPEQSLAEVMDVFRRRMEDTPIGFVATSSSGRSAMSGTNKVSYELVRPSTEGEPLKAIITVVSTSQYSVLKSTDSSKEGSRDKANSDRSTGALDETDPNALPFDSSGSESATDEGSTDRNSQIRAGEKPVGRQKDEETRKYELIYENGRWGLVTKLNEQTEKAVENAFSNALGTQI